MKRLLLVAALGLVGTRVHPQGSGRDDARWVLDQAELPQGATPSATGIQLLRGIAYRPDLRLRDGIIEFELGAPAGGFAGLAFRLASAADYEIVYFRPSESGDRWATVQYQPVFEGATTWQLYPGDGYEASLPRSLVGPIRVRLVVSGRRADVHVGSDTVPVLRIAELKRDPAAGGVGFWAASPASASRPTVLRDFRVHNEERPRLAEVALPPARATQLLRWEISQRFPAGDSGNAPRNLPDSLRLGRMPMRVVEAEASGLINLTRVLGNPAGPQRANVFGGAGWGVAYARVRVRSESTQVRRLSFAYSDRIGVYVDGMRVFSARNDFGTRYPEYLGVVGAEVDAVDVPLKSGVTDIVLAITDRAFGWGFRASFDAMTGLTILR